MGAGQSSNGNSMPTKENGSTPSNTGMVVTSTNVRRNAMNSRKRRNNGMNAGGMPIAERSITVMEEEPVNNSQQGGRRRTSGARKAMSLRQKANRKSRKGSRKH